MIPRYNDEVYPVFIDNTLHAICNTRKDAQRLIKAMKHKFATTIPSMSKAKFIINCMDIIEYGEEE